MGLLSVQLNHTRDEFWRQGGGMRMRERKGIMGKVHCLLTLPFLLLFLFISVRDFTFLVIRFERTSSAFLGSILVVEAGAKHGEESRGAECTEGVSCW